MRKKWTKPLLLLALLTVLVAPAMPATATEPAARDQLTWFLDASTRAPIAETEQRQHLSSTFLDGIGGPEEFNKALTGFGELRLERPLRTEPTYVEAVLGSTDGDLQVRLTVDDTNLVTQLGLTPYSPSPRSWSELDSRLKSLAPQVSFAASVLDPDEGCRQRHAVEPDTPRPLGSAVKLYILGALGDSVSAGTLDWDQELAIREEWKSLPSGRLQDEPAGTRLPLSEYANLMISMSDNTATDHLIHTVGRDAVLEQIAGLGGDQATNTPLLTTRELFALKGFQYPTLADTYLSLPPEQRAAMLPMIDAVPRTSIQPWTEPRDLDEIEWFGSATDMCAAMRDLWRQHGDQPRIGTAMSISDGGIGLDRAEFPTVWFKGGSEPGLVTLNHLAQTADGKLVVTNLTLLDHTAPLDPNATAEAVALARGGVELAGRG